MRNNLLCTGCDNSCCGAVVTGGAVGVVTAAGLLLPPAISPSPDLDVDGPSANNLKLCCQTTALKWLDVGSTSLRAVFMIFAPFS